VRGAAVRFGAVGAAGNDTVLKASDVTNKIFPTKFSFADRSLPYRCGTPAVSGFADDTFVLASMVDNSGYSSDIRQKYQAYLIPKWRLKWVARNWRLERMALVLCRISSW